MMVCQKSDTLKQTSDSEIQKSILGDTQRFPIPPGQVKRYCRGGKDMGANSFLLFCFCPFLFSLCLFACLVWFGLLLFFFKFS